MRLLVDNISKRIRRKQILDSVSMDLRGGRVYVVSGPNGSGKTMLFRAISGLMSVDSGSVTLDGKRLRKDFPVLPGLGITLENVGLYPELTGCQNLSYLARMRGEIGHREIARALRRVGLDPDDRRAYRKYSTGMRQRLAIAQAIMEEPGVLLLDEPTNALDREGVALVRKLITEEKERGAIVMVATHDDEDIRLLSDCVFDMRDGRLEERKEEAYAQH